MKPCLNKDVRLLPAVIGVGAMLLLLKAGGLAFSAHAQTAVPAQANGAPQTPAGAKQADGKPAESDPAASIAAARALPKIDPAASVDSSAKPADGFAPELAGTGVTPAQMDVLTSLADRRNALEDRQRQLDLQANVLAATEKRVDTKIAELKTIQAKIEALLGQRDAQDSAQLDSLVKVYTAMKPKDAARIFEKLDDDVRIAVANRMKPDIVAGVLAQLPADVAQKLTVQLATRYRMPDPALAGAAASAAATPALPAPAAAASAAATTPVPATAAASAPQANAKPAGG